MRITPYELGISAPANARSTRRTADLRPRFRAVNDLRLGMEDLILRFTGTPEKDVFVDGNFSARRIGGSSSGGGEEEGGGEGGGTTPPPENPPAPNP